MEDYEIDYEKEYFQPHDGSEDDLELEEDLID